MARGCSKKYENGPIYIHLRTGVSEIAHRPPNPRLSSFSAAGVRYMCVPYTCGDGVSGAPPLHVRMHGRGSHGMPVDFIFELVWKLPTVYSQPDTQRTSHILPHLTQHEAIVASYVLVSVEKHRNESGRQLMPYVPVPQMETTSFLVVTL